MLLIALLFLVAYLMGSIPTAVWVGKKFYGIDVREHGSRNAGATNTIRVLGWKAGLPVFLIDIMKGILAASLVMFTNYTSGTNTYINLQLVFGFSALLGHILPVFADFRGGKGVATLLGVVIALTPVPALLAFIIFLVVLFIFKYVSVGSMIAAIFYPFIIFILYPGSAISIKSASIVMSVALIITHRKNIRRLIKGEESKAGFLYKKK
jgi:acyl phosphate:glycerol-3-phosphate acyltransferase